MFLLVIWETNCYCTSTGEAEYYAPVHAGHQVNWAWQLLAEIKFLPWIATTLYIYICIIETADQVTNCTKHINISYHWIREEVQKQTIWSECVPSDKNLSDIFTNWFHVPRHKELACALEMGLRADASWGGVLIYVYTTHQHHLQTNMDSYVV